MVVAGFGRGGFGRGFGFGGFGGPFLGGFTGSLLGSALFPGYGLVADTAVDTVGGYPIQQVQLFQQFPQSAKFQQFQQFRNVNSFSSSRDIRLAGARSKPSFHWILLE